MFRHLILFRKRKRNSAILLEPAICRGTLSVLADIQRLPPPGGIGTRRENAV